MFVTLIKHGKDGRILYYTIHDRQQSLTSSHALSTGFRSGSGRERERHYDFDSLAEKDAMIRSLLERRIRDGYRLLYSWSRDARWSAGPAVASEALAPGSSGSPPSLQAGLLSRATAAHEGSVRASG